MPLSWNEIKDRAHRFSKEWADTTNEDAEAKPFLEAFFNVFGITRKKIGTFEHRVKKLDEHDGYIDLIWKGMLLVEMKSKGKDLDKAYVQAKAYMQKLPEHELPKYVLICDFGTFHLYDIEDDTVSEFALKDLRANVRLFGFMLGYQKKTYKAEDPVNIKAAMLMGDLHDDLKAAGYTGHQLELYLVRLLFCLFADDTSIFQPDIFRDYITRRTREDGSDIGVHIAHLFQILNTPYESRQSNLDEELAAFPYVNGKLFEEPISFASWNSSMRGLLLEACGLNWGAISPAIFGSMFQSVMDEKARRNLGAHYTSEKNILKLIKPLFLDELWKEFNTAKKTKQRLEEFHRKIAELKFIDPACGCGNFLVISYRELRLLEIEVIKELLYTHEGLRKEVAADADINARLLIRCTIDNFYGIEYEEFPAQIAQVAMWLVDHQMNMKVTDTFGQYVSMLPLQKSATIIHGNALRIDWHTFASEEATARLYAEHVDITHIVSEPSPVYNLEVHSKNINFRGSRPVRSETAKPYNYILGNPPFIGHQWRNDQQMKDMDVVCGKIKKAGRLDYVAAWYIKAAKYIQKFSSDLYPIEVAFVSTNSIIQGEQVGILWGELFNNYKIKIHFAHRTFSWKNEARGNAAVHVVIIGFANFDIERKTIFDYADIKGEPESYLAKNISPYLTEGKDIFVESRSTPIHSYPEMFKGSQPTDGGHLILTPEDREALLKTDPSVKKWIRPYIGGVELINGSERFCLWLKDCPPEELARMPGVKKRLELVVASRLQSTTKSVRDFSQYPTLFTQDRQPLERYLAIPEVSSENRKYIPIGYLSPETICSNKLQIIPNASIYLFGILTSAMHMAWTKHICGRLKSDFSYSPAVYNSFPFPIQISQKQMKDIEVAAQEVLNVRSSFTKSSLANLYNPLTMPPGLIKAHNELDKSVDQAYRPQAFSSDAKRMEFLFELYEQYTRDLFTKEKVKKKKKGSAEQAGV
ncbi:MAG: hypothetical protein JWO03_2357 [Bacteroidetes bacterium]|nr:hypothetical protein [Bacteroidota bacterium]